ncbi:MAG TPA: hypothetical protein VGH49_11695 [Xanthobacteraceae bacterium]
MADDRDMTGEQHAADEAPDQRSAPDQRFATDGDGRTVFFPFRQGWAGWRGYVVPDAERERGLRQVSKWFDQAQTHYVWLVPLFVVPFLFEFGALVYTHLFEAVLILLAAAPLAAALEWAGRRLAIHRLVAGLARSNRRDLTLARRHLILLAAAAASAAGIWLILALYDRRTTFAPGNDQTISYYPDISVFCVIAVVCAAGAFACLERCNPAVARLGRMEIRACLAVCVLAAAAGAWRVAAMLIDPTPAVVITDEALACGGQTIRWSDIARIALVQRLGKSVQLTIGSPAAARNGQAVVRSCEVTWLKEEYGHVHAVIYNRWLRLNPDAAIATYDDAITNAPTDAQAFTGRATAYQVKGDFSRAIADYGAAIRLAPDSAIALRNRGRAYFFAADLTAASADFLHAMRLQPDDAFGVLWLYLARARAGDKTASAGLQAGAKAVRQPDWPYPVVELFLGSRTPEAVFDAAQSTENLCEAQFYAGEWYVVQKNPLGAVLALRAATYNCPWGFGEYDAAQAELKSLAQQPMAQQQPAQPVQQAPAQPVPAAPGD